MFLPLIGIFQKYRKKPNIYIKKIMCMERDTYSKFGKNIQHSTERKTMIYLVRLDWGG